MMINGPRPSLVDKSRTTASCALDMDEETMEEVSHSRSAIKNMFEAKTAHKITYGGNGSGSDLLKSSTDPGGDLGARPKVVRQPPVVAKQDERKWVFDTINKYFDVIDEDEEEEEEDSSSSEEDEEEEDAMSTTTAYSSR
jgi:hypothetical protein